jgi:NDP-sugar pyrophosphorylase family protein
VFGAIVIVGINNLFRNVSGGPSSFSPCSRVSGETPLECVELLGQSVLQRTIENLRAAGVGMISLVSGANTSADRLSQISTQCKIPLYSESDICSSALMRASEYRQSGVETTLVIRGGVYFELDMPDLVQFHREKGHQVTSIHDSHGPITAWLIDSAHLAKNPDLLGGEPQHSAPDYMHRGYVNRFDDSHALRRFVVDVLRGNCQLQPKGREIQPGIWVGEGADVHRTARLVEPAFIGAASRVGKDCVITGGSNIERDCEIDDGTTVSDSTVLENSYVGMGLQLSRSLVNGSNLQSLERDATVTITDAAIIRPNKPERKESSRPAPTAPRDEEQVLLAPAEEGAS